MKNQNGIVARHERTKQTVIIELQAKNIKDRKHRAISTAKENQNEKEESRSRAKQYPRVTTNAAKLRLEEEQGEFYT